MKEILKLCKYFSKEHWNGLIIAFILILFSGFADFVSLTSVIPFLGLISNPDQFLSKNLNNQNGFISFFLNSNEPIIFITILFCTTVLIAGIIRIYSIKFNAFQSAKISSFLGIQGYRSSISVPYAFHSKNNSSEVIAVLSIIVPKVTGTLISCLQLINSLIQAIFIISALIFINFRTTLVALVFFSSLYFLIGSLVRKKIKNNGIIMSGLLGTQTKTIQETLGSLKNIILGSYGEVYINSFSKKEIKLRQLSAENNFLTVFPKFFLEPFGIMFIAVLGYYFSVIIGDSFEGGIALLGAFALGSQRLLPALQQIYAGWANIKMRSPDIKRLIRILNYPKEKFISNIRKIEPKVIELKSIYFSYSRGRNNIVSEVNLKINKGSKVALLGATGSGKSTIMDIFMGLTKPSKGELLINNKNVFHNTNHNLLCQWRASIAHVPQEVFLFDASIEENITLSLSKKDINKKRLEEVISIVQLDDLYQKRFKNSSFSVGEKGSMLSGGQRQRIAIARALYKDSNYLIFDEAMSSLDIDTEKSILNKLVESDRNFTIFMITHRLSTLELFDEVYQIEKGKIVLKN